MSGQGTLLISEYVLEISKTDKMDDEVGPVLFGLFGEVGGIMAAAKKHHREGKAFPGYRTAVEEEFGDTLWYLAAICRRLEFSLEDLLDKATLSDDFASVIAASDVHHGSLSRIIAPKHVEKLDDALLTLGKAAADLLILPDEKDKQEKLLRQFVDRYLKTLDVAELSFAQIARSNLKKTTGRFLKTEPSTLPRFDAQFSPEEKLPEQFEIHVNERSSGKSYLRWNGVFIGDPLTDNIRDEDGYRFHDVFHFAHAAILHWSPVMRALIKQKRKSIPSYDEAQDSGRAIVVEEGLTAWIFSKAKELNFFENQAKISFDLLKTVQSFVQGYEVDQCPLSLWEEAILQGYDVFRKVRSNQGGIIIGDRSSRSLQYKALP